MTSFPVPSRGRPWARTGIRTRRRKRFGTEEVGREKEEPSLKFLRASFMLSSLLGQMRRPLAGAALREGGTRGGAVWRSGRRPRVEIRKNGLSLF